MVGWESDGGGGGGAGDVVVRVSEASEEARRKVGGGLLGQKSDTFFFRSFLFQTERRPKSSDDIPNTLRNSAWERCLCRGDTHRSQVRGQARGRHSNPAVAVDLPPAGFGPHQEAVYCAPCGSPPASRRGRSNGINQSINQ